MGRFLPPLPDQAREREMESLLQKGEQVVKGVPAKREEELPLTPPSDGLAAHFSSPGAVLVSSRVTANPRRRNTQLGSIQQSNESWRRKTFNMGVVAGPRLEETH